MADRQGFVLSVYDFVINNLRDTKIEMLPIMLPKTHPEKRPDLKGVKGRAEGATAREGCSD